MRRPRIAAGEEGKKALCVRIHPQRVPMPVQDEYGIGLKLRHEKLHGTARRLCLRCIEIRCVEIGVTIKRSVARCQQQCIALAQRNLKGLGETDDHLPARLCAARLNATEMTRRDIGIERKVQLADVANSAPAT